MNLSYLKTHWTPEEAHILLGLLDQLRDVLWATYGSAIIEHYQSLAEKDNEDTEPLFHPEDIPF